MLELIERVRAERGMTVLLVTNDEGVAGRAGRVLRLLDGKITATLPLGEPSGSPRPPPPVR